MKEWRTGTLMIEVTAEAVTMPGDVAACIVFDRGRPRKPLSKKV